MTPQEMLAQSTLAAGLDPDQVGILARFADVQRVAAGGSILNREDTQFPLIVLLEGEGDVRGMFAQEVSHLKPGTLVGEIAFLDHGHRTADVVATKDATIAVFPEDLLDRLNDGHSDVAAQVVLNLARVLGSKLRWAQRLIDAGEAVDLRSDR